MENLLWILNSSSSIDSEVKDKALEAIHQLKDREDLGFLNTNYIEDCIAEIESVSSEIKKYEKLIIIGLGGSSLGTRALCEMLYPSTWKEKVIFLDNVDSYSVDQFLKSLEDLESVGWVLCSKSGSTIEVTSLYEYCATQIESQHNISIIGQTLIITESKKSPVYNFAVKNNRPVFRMPESIGGRFSAFTAIGMLPLHFLGADLGDFTTGFDQALDSEKILADLVGHLRQLKKQGYPNFYSFQYSNRMVSFGLWLQQLWSESLGKKSTRSGEAAPSNPVFIPCRGASDQHSVLQQIIEGNEQKFVFFHRVESSEESEFKIKEPLFEGSLMQGKGLGQLMAAEASATESAVREAGIPTMVLRTMDLNENSISQLMGLWMLAVGALGELEDVDAFNQPGVESGKVIARRVLSQSD